LELQVLHFAVASSQSMSILRCEGKAEEKFDIKARVKIRSFFFLALVAVLHLETSWFDCTAVYG